MTWTLQLALGLGGALGVTALLARRLELARMAARVAARAGRLGHAAQDARLALPVVDHTRCLGCATCVAACPEQDVLDLLHGQAAVVGPERCVGVGACERACPVDAIAVGLARAETRDDVPVVDPRGEVPGRPGLFLAGEVTAQALIRRAVEQGTAVAREVATRVRGSATRGPTVPDLCIVGAGPAGLACALEVRRLGLVAVLVDREQRVGGTVARYPRHKLVLTEPVDLPLHGRLGARHYAKEELVELWERLARDHALDLRGGQTLRGVEPRADGSFDVVTDGACHRARHVCLALGRRGTPRRLGVPGEDLPHVAYELLDARAHRGVALVVVGGGDSAVESALALAAQPGNRVTLVHRGADFPRLRSANAEALEAARRSGRVDVATGTRVMAIDPAGVRLERVDGGTGELPAQAVFVHLGGEPAHELLGRLGVSCDPESRRQLQVRATAVDPAPGSGLGRALLPVVAACVLMGVWLVTHADYYGLPRALRATHAKHDLLHPGQGLGLALGVGALLAVVVNGAYLLRRAEWRGLRWGSLRGWMGVHVVSGVLAVLAATLHAGLEPRDTVGGHAFWTLVVLLLSGVVGRHVYAWVPRAANGRELALDEVRARWAQLSAPDDPAARAFAAHARERVGALWHRRQWGGSLPGRLLALLGVQHDLRRALRALAGEGRARGVPPEVLRVVLALTREGHRHALATAHLEDLRGLLGSWRFLHRWVALLMALLTVLHVAYALAYRAHLFDGGLT